MTQKPQLIFNAEILPNTLKRDYDFFIDEFNVIYYTKFNFSALDIGKILQAYFYTALNDALASYDIDIRDFDDCENIGLLNDKGIFTEYYLSANKNLKHFNHKCDANLLKRQDLNMFKDADLFNFTKYIVENYFKNHKVCA